MLHLGQIGFFFFIAVVSVWVSYVAGKELAEWFIPSWMRYGVILALFAFMLLAGWTELGSVVSRLKDLTFEYDPLWAPSKLEQAVVLLAILVVPAFIGVIVGERHKSAGTV